MENPPLQAVVRSRVETVLNDDRIVVREKSGKLWMYGTPWHGGDFKEHSSRGLPIDKAFFLRHGKRSLPGQERRGGGFHASRAFLSLPFGTRKGWPSRSSFCHAWSVTSLASNSAVCAERENDRLLRKSSPTHRASNNKEAKKLITKTTKIGKHEEEAGFFVFLTFVLRDNEFDFIRSLISLLTTPVTPFLHYYLSSCFPFCLLSPVFCLLSSTFPRSHLNAFGFELFVLPSRSLSL